MFLIVKKKRMYEFTHIRNNKYKSLFTNIPTGDTELSSIHADIDVGINCYNIGVIFITPVVFNTCISQLKKYTK